MPFPISFAYPWYLTCLLAIAPVIWLWRRGRSPLRRLRETVSLVLRVLILGLLILSLAGLQWVRASDAQRRREPRTPAPGAQPAAGGVG